MMAVLHNVVDNVIMGGGYLGPAKDFSFATVKLSTSNNWICAVISCSIDSLLNQKKKCPAAKAKSLVAEWQIRRTQNHPHASCPYCNVGSLCAG
jgi:hypothetical protein